MSDSITVYLTVDQWAQNIPGGRVYHSRGDEIVVDTDVAKWLIACGAAQVNKPEDEKPTVSPVEESEHPEGTEGTDDVLNPAEAITDVKLPPTAANMDTWRAFAGKHRIDVKGLKKEALIAKVKAQLPKN